MEPQVYAFADAILALERFLAGQGGTVDHEEIRSVIFGEYTKITSAHRWLNLRATGRITLRASVDGTASYDASTGVLTTTTAILDDDWMNDASVFIDDVLCDIEEVTSTTTCTLNAVMRPAEDKTAEAITIFQRWIALPTDFVSMWEPQEATLWHHWTPRRLEEILAQQRQLYSPGYSNQYAVGPVEDCVGVMGFYPWPPSDDTKEITFSYLRRPRELIYSGHSTDSTTGRVTVAAGSAVVAGTDTTFDDSMEGTLIRFGVTTALPRGREATRRYKEQRIVKDVTSATALILDAPSVHTHTGVQYVITDFIDLGPLCYEALMANCKARLAVDRKFDNAAALVAVARSAMIDAKGDESPVQQRRIAGRGPATQRVRLRDEATDRTWTW